MKIREPGKMGVEYGKKQGEHLGEKLDKKMGRLTHSPHKDQL